MHTRRASLAQYLLPRLEDVVFATLFVAVIVLKPRLLNGTAIWACTSPSVDTSWIVAAFRATFFAMTGEPLTPHEWLSQITFACLPVHGLDGVVLLCATLIASTFTLVQEHRAAQRDAPVALGLVMLAVAVSRLHWLARPHLFTLLLVVLWTDGLERRAGTTPWWHLPALMLLGVNLHGAFIAGFVIWGAYVAGCAWQRWVGRRMRQAPGYGRALALIGASSFLVFSQSSGRRFRRRAWAT
jgi:hypothetical protein